MKFCLATCLGLQLCHIRQWLLILLKKNRSFLAHVVLFCWFHCTDIIPTFTTNIWSKPLLSQYTTSLQSRKPPFMRRHSCFPIGLGLRKSYDHKMDFNGLQMTPNIWDLKRSPMSSPDSKHQSNSLQTWTTLAIISFRSQGPSLFLSGVFFRCVELPFLNSGLVEVNFHMLKLQIGANWQRVRIRLQFIDLLGLIVHVSSMSWVSQ